MPDLHAFLDYFVIFYTMMVSSDVGLILGNRQSEALRNEQISPNALRGVYVFCEVSNV
jgi:hypothetical protein